MKGVEEGRLLHVKGMYAHSDPCLPRHTSRGRHILGLWDSGWDEARRHQ